MTLSTSTEEVQEVGELSSNGDLYFPQSTADSMRLEQLCMSEDTNANQTDGPSDLPDIIYTRALRQLRDGELTDDAIYKYLRLLCDTDLQRRCEVLDPLFAAYIFGVTELHGVQRDIHRDFRRRAIFDCDFLFVPLTTAGHTSLLTVDYAHKEILHEDSVYGFHSGTDKHIRSLLHFLRDHWLWKNGTMDGFSEDWRCKVVPREEVPQQTDAVSCGVFTCGFATLRAQGIDIQQFHMSHVHRMRIHMANCILTHTCPTLWATTTCTREADTQSMSMRKGRSEINLVLSTEGSVPNADTHHAHMASDGQRKRMHDDSYSDGMSVKYQSRETGLQRETAKNSKRVGSRQRTRSPLRSSATSARARGRQKMHSRSQSTRGTVDAAISVVGTSYVSTILGLEEHVDDGVVHGRSPTTDNSKEWEDNTTQRGIYDGRNYITEQGGKRRRIQDPDVVAPDAEDADMAMTLSSDLVRLDVGLSDNMCSVDLSGSKREVERKRGPGQAGLDVSSSAKRSRK